MPGMVDTHRHMWQTALRGFGADWTLSQYFVFYYLSWGKIFRPEDIHAGNLLSAIESLDAGVTTTVDWSHGLQTIEHGEAALDALREVPGRFVLALGNLLGAPWEWTNVAGVPDLPRPAVDQRHARSRSSPSTSPATRPFPSGARSKLPASSTCAVTTHAGVWGATNDESIRLMYENGFMDARHHLRARRHLDRGLVPADRRNGRHRVGLDRERAERRPGLPAHLGAAQARHPGVAVDGHECLVERRPVLGDAGHAVGRPVARAPRGPRQGRDRRPQPAARRAGRPLGHDRRRTALGLDGVIGSVTAGKQADLVLIKNDASPAMYPLLHPYGSLVFQAGRGDVHTVLVNGRVVKHEHQLVGIDLDGRQASGRADGRVRPVARSASRPGGTA